MWEDIGTIHNSVADYGPDEHRLSALPGVARCSTASNEAGENGGAMRKQLPRCFVAALCALAGSAAGQGYPAKPGKGASSASRRRAHRRDRAHRRAGHDRSLGQSFVVENKPGERIIATEAVCAIRARRLHAAVLVALAAGNAILLEGKLNVRSLQGLRAGRNAAVRRW